MYLSSEQNEPTMLGALESVRATKSTNPTLDLWVSHAAESQGFAKYNLANHVLQAIYSVGNTDIERFDLIYYIWFGTDAGLRGAIAQVKFLFYCGAIRKMGYFRYLKLLLKSIPRGLKIYTTCKKQREAWPFLDNWHYLHIPLKKIHSDFNIHKVSFH